MDILLSKFFRKKQNPYSRSQSSDCVFRPQLAEDQFAEENVRFIIFRDHDKKGRCELFDSFNNGCSNQNAQRNNCHSNRPKKCARNASNSAKLAEMMFGTVPMSRKSTTFKVHTIRSPPRLMITKVFIPKGKSNKETPSDAESFLNSIDLYEMSSATAHVPIEPQQRYSSLNLEPCARSVPVDVPNRATTFGEIPCTGSVESELSASTHLMAYSTQSLMLPSSTCSSSLCQSYSSKKRRRRRYKNKTIEHVLTSSLNEDNSTMAVPLCERPTKIGIGIIFVLPDEDSPSNRHFQSFFFSHIMLIENYVDQLKESLDKALVAKDSKQDIYQAINVFLASISSLYNAPRLKHPAWLSIMAHTSQRVQLSALFLKDFQMLVEKCYTKNTKFFLGVLITAVLTHHLSWAPTVAPVKETPTNSYLDKHTAKWVKSLVQSHPYNPLWAQLGDLYGAIGVPICLSRTAIVGRNEKLVSAILFIISYFIRCGEIVENVESFPVFPEDDVCSSSLSDTRDDSPAARTARSPNNDDSKERHRRCLFESTSSSRATPTTADDSSSAAESGDVRCHGRCKPIGAACGRRRCRDDRCAAMSQRCRRGVADCECREAHLDDRAASTSCGCRRCRGGRDDVAATTGRRCCRHRRSSNCNNCRQQANGVVADFVGSTSDCARRSRHFSNRDEVERPEMEDDLWRRSPDWSASDDIREIIAKSVPSNLFFVDSQISRVSANAADRSAGFDAGGEFRDDDDTLSNGSDVAESYATTTKNVVVGRRSSRLSAELQRQESQKMECRLREERIVENPRIEDVRNVGRAAPSEATPTTCERNSGRFLHRVALGEHDAENENADELRSERTSEGCVESVGRPAPTAQRGISIFDEYFDADPPLDLHLNLREDDAFLGRNGEDGSSTSNGNNEVESINPSEREVCDARTLDDIVDAVPCPDVGDIDVSRLLPRNVRDVAMTTFGCQHENSQVLSSEHFGDRGAAAAAVDVINLPDGPSKQVIHKAISMLQDRFNTSSVCGRVTPGAADSEVATKDQVVGCSATRSRRHRQASGQSTTAAIATNRCRSVTLSESSHSRIDMANYVELSIPFISPEIKTADVDGTCLSDECNFGRSLFGDYCPQYSSHFILHGTGDKKFLREPYTLLHQDLKIPLQNSVLDEPVLESTYIVADMDDWTVQLFCCSCEHPDDPLKPLPLVSSPLVCNLIESVSGLGKLKMSPEFCLLHLEDQLQSIYLKSRVLAEYINIHRRLYLQELSTLLGVDVCDLPLLLAVARTHSPHLFRRDWKNNNSSSS